MQLRVAQECFSLPLGWNPNSLPGWSSSTSPSSAGHTPSCSLCYIDAVFAVVPPGSPALRAFLQSPIYTLPLASRFSLLFLDWLNPWSFIHSQLSCHLLRELFINPWWRSSWVTQHFPDLSLHHTSYDYSFHSCLPCTLERVCRPHAWLTTAFQSLVYNLMDAGWLHGCATCVVIQGLMLRKVRVCGEEGTLLHCWWEWKFMQPLWRIVWRFIKKTNIGLPYGPAIPHLGIYLEKTIIWRDTCTPVFTATPFTRAKICKQPTCPLTEYSVMEYYSATKKEQNTTICSNMGGPRDYLTKWNKSDRER